jgi:hypothetical protein
MAPRMSRQRHIIGCDLSFDDSCMSQSSSETKKKRLAYWTNADALNPSANGLMVRERQKRRRRASRTFALPPTTLKWDNATTIFDIYCPAMLSGSRARSSLLEPVYQTFKVPIVRRELSSLNCLALISQPKICFTFVRGVRKTFNS